MTRFPVFILGIIGLIRSVAGKSACVSGPSLGYCLVVQSVYHLRSINCHCLVYGLTIEPTYHVLVYSING